VQDWRVPASVPLPAAHAVARNWPRRLQLSSRLELRDIGARAPHAERLGNEGEIARTIGKLVLFGNKPHTGGVFVHHAVRAFKVQEHGARSRMPARAET